MQYFGGDAVFIFAIGLLLLWLIIASTMQPPAAVRTKMYPLPAMDKIAGIELQKKLAQLHGVREVMIVTTECMACLKVDMSGFDETTVKKLTRGENNVGQ